MKRFKFSLESVLTVRKKALEDERIFLAKILNTLTAQKKELEQLHLKLYELRFETQKYQQEGVFNPVVMDNMYSFSRLIEEKIKKQENIIEQTQQILSTQRKKTQIAYIKVQSLEKLKEKQKANYDKEIFIEEIKELDDIVNSRRITA